MVRSFSGNFVLLKSVEKFSISIGSSYGNLILKVRGYRCFGVWPEHGYFIFFEGGLLCSEN